jgi:hypothetical protein
MKTSFVFCVMFSESEYQRPAIVQELIGLRWKKCVFINFHLEYLNKWNVAYYVDMYYMYLALRSSLWLIVIVIWPVLCSSLCPACNGCRHATLCMRYKQFTRAYNESRLNLLGERWEHEQGLRAVVCVTLVPGRLADKSCSFWPVAYSSGLQHWARGNILRGM